MSRARDLPLDTITFSTPPRRARPGRRRSTMFHGLPRSSARSFQMIPDLYPVPTLTTWLQMGIACFMSSCLCLSKSFSFDVDETETPFRFVSVSFRTFHCFFLVTDLDRCQDGSVAQWGSARSTFVRSQVQIQTWPSKIFLNKNT